MAVEEPDIASFQITSNLWVLGTSHPQVNVLSQQRRAFEIVRWMHEDAIRNGPAGDKRTLLVVGAGFGGLTAAVAAAHIGWNVTILEKLGAPLQLQKGCHTRWLYPYIREWPSPSHKEVWSGLPLVNWEAGTAAAVAEAIERSFKHIREATKRIDLDPHVGSVDIGRHDRRMPPRRRCRRGCGVYNESLATQRISFEAGTWRALPELRGDRRDGRASRRCLPSARRASARLDKVTVMTATTDLGPIARKIIAAGRKQQRHQVVDLAAVRSARDRMREIIDRAVPSSDIAGEHPGFTAYAYVTNWVVGLIEAGQDVRELGRHVGRIASAEEEYLPEGPPMSPITRSMFGAWSLWDLTVGVKRESLGSIVLAIGRVQGLDPLFLGVLEKLVESRLGLHVHEGTSHGVVTLRELVTGEQRTCVCPAGYEGEPGEVWLARVLPPPVETLAEAVVLTTPYVVLNPGPAGWQAYLDRMLPAIASDPRAAYARLMKRGLNERYWLEYVFEAYANHRTEAVFLMGLPDVAESRPHSRVSQDRELWIGE